MWFTNYKCDRHQHWIIKNKQAGTITVNKLITTINMTSMDGDNLKCSVSFLLSLGILNSQAS